MLEHLDKHIICDKRELDVYLTFLDLGFKNVQFKMIEIADFIISSRTAIERKGASYNREENRWQHDFVDSLIDNRLFKQASNMHSNYENVIYIIENWDALWKDKRVTDNAKLTCMATLSTKYGGSIIPTNNKTETVHVIMKLAEKDAEDGYVIPIAKKPRKSSTYERQVFLLTSLLLVGRNKAIELLSIFETPLNVFKALANAEMKVNSKGNSYKIESAFDSIKGYGKKFVTKNKEILTTRCKVPINK